MKLQFVRISGFRGYRKPIQFDFSESFTVIDGRNGAGKSTVFDAVEFALTGSISKYLDAKASGESVVDYLWWNGESDTKIEHFVEVGFREGDEAFTVKRTRVDSESLDLSSATNRLLDEDFAPRNALGNSALRQSFVTSTSRG